MAGSSCITALKYKLFDLMLLVYLSELAFGKIRYSIREEMETGAFVGNVAEDLGLDIRRLSARQFRLASADKRQCLEVNMETGTLFTKERIDREQLCGQMSVCVLPFEIVVEQPLEMYRGEVEVIDINDNSPRFPESTILLQMAESIAIGSRFPLESALDPDMGINTVTTYNLSPNAHFGLQVETAEDGVKIVELLLGKPLDRESQSSFQLMLTATDGGSPPRSGTARILITVLDSNDNAPVFDRKIYRVDLIENSPRGTLVATVRATDPDEGSNAEVTYTFSNRVSKKVHELFSLDPRTGEIRIKGIIDYEEGNTYSLDLQAVDNGSPAISGHCKVMIKVIDMNDNAPEILLTSVVSMIPESATLGTVTALIDVIDRDSGKNGQVHCEIPKNVPFKLHTTSSTHYKLITTASLDREATPGYNLSILAWDSGRPPLSSNKTVQISVFDENDNAPMFARRTYTVYVTENNLPGASIFTVTASDPDVDQNSYVSYSFKEILRDSPAPTYLKINSVNGTIYALRSFDYEQVKSFQVQVQARDAGVPPLSSSATVNVIILDQNDNAPVIVSPSAKSGSAAEVIVPQSAGQNYLVTKIIATDADSGQNARLFYQVVRAIDPRLFNVGLNTGEIRTTRGILEQDAPTQSLIILVRDNGQPTLSSTATIVLLLFGNLTAIPSESNDLVRDTEQFSYLNLYLIITLGSTSFLLLAIIIVLLGIKCKQDKNLSESNPTICCYKPEDSIDGYSQGPVPKGSANYCGQTLPISDTYRYTVCLSPESSKSDFLFLKPCNPTLPQEHH
ncbi:protocadherin-10-like [Rhincodon typus]|uniref:protocadherin-10-like n=1 Tax=Rhincodon typus TaxID=259920 RepID=UPI0020306D8E|nr:protocadherin-10-like [Rhincodon typus]